MSPIIDVLSRLIESAEKLIEKANDLSYDMPDRISVDFWEYNNEYARPLIADADAWKMETLECLRTLYGEKSRQELEFNNLTIQQNQYYDILKDIKKELKRCVAYLNALISADKVRQQMQNQSTDDMSEKTPMVFISHSSADKEFADALVTLLENLGFNNTNLFCSSISGYGIKLGGDIFDTLRNLFNEHNLFVIFIHSPRYYDSPISLNEMGAAWVLKTDSCSFLTKDMDFSMMKGVVNERNISIKVDKENTETLLNELKDKLIKLFGLESIDSNKWERKRKSFMEKVLSIN